MNVNIIKIKTVLAEPNGLLLNAIDMPQEIILKDIVRKPYRQTRCSSVIRAPVYCK